MVMDDLEEVMFGVLEDHEDAFGFQDDLHETDHVEMREFRAECHLPDGGL